MSLLNLEAGRALPDDCNVVIEIPMNGAPIKYEVDKASGALFVDRFLSTAMHYPCNYGYIPQTLCGDGDPVDALVLTPIPLQTGVVVRCRPIALLRMEDENGEDAKILMAPVVKACPSLAGINGPDDVSQALLRQISHFFEHYKDLEAGKFVRTHGWADAQAARQEILASRDLYLRGK